MHCEALVLAGCNVKLCTGHASHALGPVVFLKKFNKHPTHAVLLPEYPAGHMQFANDVLPAGEVLTVGHSTHVGF